MTTQRAELIAKLRAHKKAVSHVDMATGVWKYRWEPDELAAEAADALQAAEAEIEGMKAQRQAGRETVSGWLYDALWEQRMWAITNKDGSRNPEPPTPQVRSQQLANKIYALASSPTPRLTEGQPPITDDQIKHMVDRFLGWRLPENFTPDCGIHFDADAAKKLNPINARYEPVGTNLFDATQATAMVRHMVEGLAPRLTEAEVEKALWFALYNDGSDDMLPEDIAPAWTYFKTTKPGPHPSGVSFARDRAIIERQARAIAALGLTVEGGKG